jgi:hypothetical protein
MEDRSQESEARISEARAFMHPADVIEQGRPVKAAFNTKQF